MFPYSHIPNNNINNNITINRGNYAVFEKTLEERMENQQKAAASVAAKKAHMQAFVDKFRYNAKRASLVQSRLKAIGKLEDVEVCVVFLLCDVIE